MVLNQSGKISVKVFTIFIAQKYLVPIWPLDFEIKQNYLRFSVDLLDAEIGSSEHF